MHFRCPSPLLILLSIFFRFCCFLLSIIFYFSLRLRDTSVQYLNERILHCEANVGEEQVKLQLLTPPGKDLETVSDQLSSLQVRFVL